MKFGVFDYFKKKFRCDFSFAEISEKHSVIVNFVLACGEVGEFRFLSVNYIVF